MAERLFPLEAQSAVGRGLLLGGLIRCAPHVRERTFGQDPLPPAAVDLGSYESFPTRSDGCSKSYPALTVCQPLALLGRG